MTLAENLVRAVDAKGLNLKVEDLEHLEGMGAVKTMIVVAALEFARRRIKPGGLKITTPADILPLIRHFADRKQEHFLCITINGANEVLNVCVVSMGLSTAPQSTPARSSRTPSPTAPPASSWPTTTPKAASSPPGPTRTLRPGSRMPGKSSASTSSITSSSIPPPTSAFWRKRSSEVPVPPR
jgi:hypothetical protein